MNPQHFKEFVWTETFEKRLEHLYGFEQIETQRIRYLQMLQKFQTHFTEVKTFDIFSSSGRIEVGGNHTDHQLGRVVAMAVDLDTLAFARKNDDNVVRLISKDYDIQAIELSDLSIKVDEHYTSMALIRGIAHELKAKHVHIGGFDAYVESNVLSGSGLSSSASIEVLIAKLFDHYYGSGQLSVSDYAIMGQKAENIYFNKPCGLMDQMVIAHGGFCAIDFYHKDQALVTKLDAGHLLDDFDVCLVNSGGSHADLSLAYAQIFEDCTNIAAYFNQTVLSRVEFKTFYDALPQLNHSFDTRAILRAYHFFKENERVLHLTDTIRKQDTAAFLSHIISSGDSSNQYLKNVLHPHDSKQGLALALMMAEHHLKQHGAWRVHGGGFAGTILMFVPKDMTSSLKASFESVFGEASFFKVRLRTEGVTQLV
jgi:galactokinase